MRGNHLIIHMREHPDTRHMFRLSSTGYSSARPRVVAIGVGRHPLRLPSEPASGGGLGIDERHLAAASPLRDMLLVMSQAARLIRDDGYEAIHLNDSRFAPAAFYLRRRYGTPVSATLHPADMIPRLRIPGTGLRSFARLDEAFVSDPEVAATLRLRVPRLPLTEVLPVARSLPAPTDKALAACTNRLTHVVPGRVVIALVWPARTELARWYRDAVAPLLLGNPVTLLLGVPSRTEFRSLTAQLRRRGDFVPLYGRVEADQLAAAARCADVFVSLGASARKYGAEDEALALTSSRVPLVASGAGSAVLEHERNAFLTDSGDGFALVSTLNKMLALPAVQRHELGIEFAAHTLARWTDAANAETYARRFAALVGRPQIPAELRAA